MAPTTLESPIDFVAGVLHGHVGGMAVNQRWRRLRFDESGHARLVGIFGWLLGLHHGGKEELAAQLARVLFEDLDYLDGYGGDIDGMPGVPRFRVCLSDDGTFHGFRLTWYAHSRVAERSEGHDDTMTWSAVVDGVRRRCLYVYNYNGGMLYHGPGHGETYSATLSNRPWSIDT